jgi:hypothetical protein
VRLLVFPYPPLLFPRSAGACLRVCFVRVARSFVLVNQWCLFNPFRFSFSRTVAARLLEPSLSKQNATPKDTWLVLVCFASFKPSPEKIKTWTKNEKKKNAENAIRHKRKKKKKKSLAQ